MLKNSAGVKKRMTGGERLLQILNFVFEIMERTLLQSKRGFHLSTQIHISV
jgi:hypothetical protein